MPRRIVAATLIVIVAVLLGLLFWPEAVGLEKQTGIAQVVAFRTAALVIALILAAILLLVVLAARRVRRGAGALLVLVLAFAGAQAAVQATRGWASTDAPPASSGSITVLSWNTRGDAPGADRIAALAIAEKADIVSLPETSQATAAQVAELMKAAGRPMWVHNRYFDEVLKARTTSLLISASLGRYRLDLSAGSTRIIPSGVFRPIDGTGPVIVAAHPVAPVPGEMPAWREGLQWIAAHCDSPDTIVAGDFNSTLDHWSGLGRDGGDLGQCHDGAHAMGGAAVGSWPTDVPAGFGTQIDHVMAGSDWTFTSFRVIQTEDAAGSDHRPVVATLRPATPAG